MFELRWGVVALGLLVACKSNDVGVGQESSAESESGTESESESSTESESGTESETGDALPEIPTLELHFSQVKQFEFSWAPTLGAEYYQLFESFDVGKGFVQLGGDIEGE